MVEGTVKSGAGERDIAMSKLVCLKLSSVKHGHSKHLWTGPAMGVVKPHTLINLNDVTSISHSEVRA